MKTETEWQARALEISEVFTRFCVPESSGAETILTFAKEYAAEACAEVARLSSQVERLETEAQFLRSSKARAELVVHIAESLLDDPEHYRSGSDFDYEHDLHDKIEAVRTTIADLRAQLVKCNNAVAATMAIENELRAQLAAAGPVKVPFDIGAFVWSWLMDYCKRMGVAPARQNELFKLCDAIRAEVLRLNAPPKAETTDEFMQGVQRTSNEIKKRQRELASEFQKLVPPKENG